MLRIFLLLAGLGSMLIGRAQFYAWGWGPAITAALNGDTLSCTAYDPISQSTSSYALDSVNDYDHWQGILAYRRAGTSVGALIYDVNDHAWHDSTFTDDCDWYFGVWPGIMSYQTTSFDLGAATYDPFLHQWKHMLLANVTNGATAIADEVIGFVDSTGVPGGAFYDPLVHEWNREMFLDASAEFVQIQQGVIGWTKVDAGVGGAVYDLAMGAWVYETFDPVIDGHNVSGGVIGYISAVDRRVGGAAYDADLHQWVYEVFSDSSANQQMTVQGGTVKWMQGSTPMKMGFLTSQHQWAADAETELVCTYYTEVISDVGGFDLAYLRCMSTGAQAQTHACGDGHNITRRWTWKQYASDGTYAPVLTVSNQTTSHTCDGSVTFTSTAEQEHGAVDEPRVYPNPAADRMMVDLGSWQGSTLRVVDAMGRVVRMMRPVIGSDLHLELGGMAPGAYRLELRSGQRMRSLPFLKE